MPRYAVKLFYDGAEYHGFSPQPNQKTVAGEIIRALQESRLVKGREGNFQAASRTDAGASALGQTIAFTTHEPFTLARLNAFLPMDLRCWAVAERPADFNPRREALIREYIYVAPYSGESLAEMRKAAALFKGTHDFHNFTKTPHTPCERTLRRLTVTVRGGFIFFDFTSKSYAWGMIRKIVSTLLDAGSGRTTLESVERLLQASHTVKQGLPLAPSENLMLLDVKYRFPFATEGEVLRKLCATLAAKVAHARLLETALTQLRRQ